MPRDAQLHLSLRQLDEILDLHPEPFVVIRHRDDIVVRCNVAYAKSVGKRVCDVVGQPIMETTKAVDEEARAGRHERLEQEGSYSVTEIETRRPDGAIRWVSGSVVLTKLHGELYRVGVGQDITERKEMELSLRDALRQVQTLQALLPICSSCHSIQNDEGYWQRLETYFSEHSDVVLTQGLCPACAEKL